MSNYSYFGIPERNLRAAEESAQRKCQHQFHVYVPSREEVASLNASKLGKILTGWMCNAATEIIPSRTQISEVKLVLLERSDVSEISDLISMCDCYISGE